MKSEYLIGNHSPEQGTVQDVIDVLMQMTAKARRDSFVRICVGDDIYELFDIQMSQSDQMEPHELKVFIRAHPLAR